ncbi:MAG: ATP-binding cassette domain-containing protein [Mollicutes bacterium PWAP]|nr:ATP-binding cassette domain-containing protein [Mollicutes bacterium PWAP]
MKKILNAIEFKNVVVDYKKEIVIKNIDLTIKKSSFTTIVGASGSGKSTLLQTMNGLKKIKSGNILLFNNDITDMSLKEKTNLISYIVQQGGLFDHLNIKENFELVRKIKQKTIIKKMKLNLVPKKEIKNEKNNGNFSKIIFQKRLFKLFDKLQINKKFYEKFPIELSGGQQQRIGIIRALILENDILLMDEPFSALDPITRTATQNLTYKLKEELGITIIMVSHDPDEVLKLSDFIYILKDGKIYKNKCFTAEEIKKTKDKYIRSFFLLDVIEDFSIIEGNK